ncbi:hypothetical protein FLONG3_3215 [Fusarium longipes]|uniref:Uncharacterized protein n=1 Tax=Fusarium longipes TaxID=694270 RepID=A0A395T1U0_9HYPO|nr:hypothetical protein FLONG3_3215 [Fusarium longipes]
MMSRRIPGQWRFVNLDHNEHLKSPDRPNVTQVAEVGSNLTKILRNPIWARYKTTNKTIETARKKKAHGDFAKLPREIVLNIIFSFEDSKDGLAILSLGMTCTYFFRLLGVKMQSVLQKDAGPWRNERLSFAGPWAPGIPDGAGTDEEEHDWHARRIQTFHELHTYPVSLGHIQPATPLTAPEIFQLPGYRSNRIIDMMIRDCMSTVEDAETFQRMIQVLMQDPGCFNKAQMSHVLRNLTTKEYVRGDVLATLYKNPDLYNEHHDIIAHKKSARLDRPYHLGEALMAMITYLHGYMINQAIWRDSLELDRRHLRLQRIHFFTRMEAVEAAAVQNERAAAQYAQSGGHGPPPTQVAVNIPPRDDLELEFDFGIEHSDSEDDWETVSWNGSDVNNDN